MWHGREDTEPPDVQDGRSKSRDVSVWVTCDSGESFCGCTVMQAARNPTMATRRRTNDHNPLRVKLVHRSVLRRDYDA